MQDEMIIDLFWQRSEDAIRALDCRYGSQLLELSLRIVGDASDAEECVNDAYLGIWNAIPPMRPCHLLSYAKRIVRNHSINRYHKNSAQKRNSQYDIAFSELEACLPSAMTVEDQLQGMELTRILEEFLAASSSENRVIFLRRYWYADAYADIAQRTGLSKKTVSVRLVRLRKQFADYLGKRGIQL